MDGWESFQRMLMSLALITCKSTDVQTDMMTHDIEHRLTAVLQKELNFCLFCIHICHPPYSFVMVISFLETVIVEFEC